MFSFYEKNCRRKESKEWAREAHWGIVVKCLKRLNNVLCLLCSRFLSFFVLFILLICLFFSHFCFHAKICFSRFSNVFPCGKNPQIKLDKDFVFPMFVVCEFYSFLS